MNAWQLIVAGGPMMAPIFLCSVFALAIIIEKLTYFSNINSNITTLRDTVFELLKKNDIKEAVTQCDNSPSPAAKIFKVGILKFGASREELREVMQDASLSEIPKLEQKLGILATIAHIAPLLGFLGTVIGIAGSFFTFQSRASALNSISASDLAAGIWQALIATAAGLIVAIPVYIAYNYLVSRVNGIINEMEHGATELVNLLSDLLEAQSAKKGGHKVEI